MVRVLITRPEPGATRTLNALLAKGIEAKSIPLTEIHPLEFEVPAEDFETLIITSQNAIFHGARLLEQRKTSLVFVVGKRTAESLKGHTIAAWAETAEELLPKIISHSPKRLLYICGQTRRPELELGLTAAGIAVEAIEVYSATPTRNAAAQLKTLFESQQSAIVLFHAPSAVDAFFSAMKNQNLSEAIRFLCLSAAIAAHLPAQWQNRISIADHPDEAAMIRQLDKLLA